MAHRANIHLCFAIYVYVAYRYIHYIHIELNVPLDNKHDHCSGTDDVRFQIYIYLFTYSHYSLRRCSKFARDQPMPVVPLDIQR